MVQIALCVLVNVTTLIDCTGKLIKGLEDAELVELPLQTPKADWHPAPQYKSPVPLKTCHYIISEEMKRSLTRIHSLNSNVPRTN